MTDADRWLLPDGVDEILPPQARRLEALRRRILDVYTSWGYELVIPPLVEFLDSLAIVPSSKLRLRTFKIVDQLSGRTLGVRADITSQVARIDAHGMQATGPNRLCYADSVLHTTPSSLLASRCPIRIGAELYGHAGNASDVEVIALMLETLRLAQVGEVHLAFGHVGIYRALLDHAGLDPARERALFRAIQHKAPGEIEAALTEAGISDAQAEMIRALPRLSGDIKVLDEAEAGLRNAPTAVHEAIAELRSIASGIQARFPDQALYFDLGELRGYEYHTGVVFAAYRAGHGEAVAKGGRYDDIGEVFGRKRPATGFDADLKSLLALGTFRPTAAERVFAPASDDPALHALINRLRGEGRQVIVELPGQHEQAAAMNCTREIVQENGAWHLRDVANPQS